MWRIGIAEEREGRLLSDARTQLARLPLVIEAYDPACRYDAVVLGEGTRLTAPPRTRWLILPGGSACPETCTADHLVLSYGMGEKDTVTLAAGRGTCVVSLRRDLPGLSGGIVCRQDAVLPFNLPASRSLPLAALLFLCKTE